MVTKNSCDYSPTQHFVQIGGANGTLVSVDPSTANYVLTSNGAAAPSFKVSAAGTGDVTAAGNLTDNFVVRGDGGAKGVQTSTVNIDDNGHMVNTSQPCFLAYLNATAANVTGDGTTYTVVFGNEVFDQAANFDTGTGIFTAPVTGKYYFTGRLLLTGVLSTHTEGVLQVVTTNLADNRAWVANPYAMLGAGGYSVTPFSVIVDMNATDTCKINITVSNGTKVVGVGGLGALLSQFSGYLIC